MCASVATIKAGSTMVFVGMVCLFDSYALVRSQEPYLQIMVFFPPLFQFLFLRVNAAFLDKLGKFWSTT